MRHWYREPFSTYQFFADVLHEFDRCYPDDELDLLESSRDRHGYDCVLIKRSTDKMLTRYVQLKSTEKNGATIPNIHVSMVLEPYREIVQTVVSDSGKCSYHCLSDMGRLLYLALAVAGACQKSDSTSLRSELTAALSPLPKMLPTFSLPSGTDLLLSQWTKVPRDQLLAWDNALQDHLPRFWRKVVRPLTEVYRSVFPEKDRSIDLNPCWTRPVKRADLVRFLFRGTDITGDPTIADASVLKGS